MAFDSTVNLRKFLDRQFFDDSHPPCKKLSLIHLKVDGTLAANVSTFLPDPHPTRAEVEALAQEIMSTAQADADGMGTMVQRYGILSYWDDSGTSAQRQAFTVAGQGHSGAEFADSEPATKDGLLAQLMRHNEANMKTSVTVMGSVVATLQRQNDQLSIRTSEMAAKQIEMMELRESLASQKHNRDLEQKRLEHGQQLKQDLFDRLKVFLPVVANRIAGKKVFPEPVNPQAALMREWATSLDTTQMDRMQQILKPEQMLAILEILQTQLEPAPETDTVKQLEAATQNMVREREGKS